MYEDSWNNNLDIFPFSDCFVSSSRKMRINLSNLVTTLVIIHILASRQMVTTYTQASILHDSKLVSSLLTSSAIPPKP